ncbi:MAG: hypothetical protein K2Q97_05245 [Burkholderiaceae bacterium]|nr:hypothetical protein [Burkholderiaceae bacterium]
MARRTWMGAVLGRALAGSLVGAAAWGLQGCASVYYGDSPVAGLSRVNLIEVNERAVDALLLNAPLDPSQPVLVASLVNVDRLTESSRLGRMFAEQMAGRMVQLGLRVTEVKMRENLLLHREQGELLLSREAREVSRSQNAQAVVVGTYAVSASVVYITLKLVNPVGNTVVAAHSYSVNIDQNVSTLLRGR